MGNVIDIRTGKSKDEPRSKLHIDHMTGKVTGSPHLKRSEADDFGDRMQRIKASLEKINALMTELKKSSRRREDQDD